MNKPKVEMSKATIGYLINKTALYFRIAGLQVFKEKKFSVTHEQFVILYILSIENGIYQRQLGKIALKDRPNITRLVDILENKGLLYREIDPNDRRIVKLFITEEGKEQVNTIYPAILEFNNKALEDITAEEEILLKGVLEKIRNNLDETFKLQF
ncbi:MAG: MarR family transcriptional regulator [Candidatus Gastranaerophilales bacterium]|nr:MarR family transcriptional regulator [Candidatus Gastranaerophilales bacterium]